MLQKALTVVDGQSHDFKATRASLAAVAQDAIAMKPNIAAEWQPGSIVIYSAWALQAHAFPGPVTACVCCIQDATDKA